MITKKQAEDIASAGEVVCKGLARGFRRYVEGQAEIHEQLQARLDYETAVRADALITLVKMTKRVVFGVGKGERR